ncbi:MAG: ABC transporter substrate-binding protein [Gammaproteobacteria bacterium]|jgi:iron complex transport system substrate-binding protein|nr:ABC transporter substrate-binding protein [Gammaproteobacteria bacterium]
MMRLVLLIFISILPFSSLGADKPQRIVSMSLCSDELLLLLSEPANIVSLSYLSVDPRYSYLNKDNNIDLTGVYLNRGQAEEIIPLEPDLILSTRFSASTAVNLLQNFGYPVTNLGFPTTLEQTFQQIQEVAQILGEQERGTRLIQVLQNRIRIVQESLEPQRDLTAVFYSNNGFSFGSGTLRDEFLNSLGMKNLASEKGLIGSGKLPIELLISEQPDLLLIDQSGLHDEKLAQPLLQHPVLEQYFPAEKVIVLPSTLFQCAGPSLVEAYELMAQALGKL